MSINATPSSSCQGGSLSCNVTTIVAVIAAMTFSASGAAPTPLYQAYQSHFGLTPFMVTVIFATYVLCLLLALLTVGSLSDYVGRRPAILGALAMNIVAMLIFMTAGSAVALIVARAVQGFATGFAVTTLGATILDTDRERAPVLNSVTAFAGLAAGTLGAGVLVTYAPAPEQLVFLVLLVASAMEAAVLWYMPETAELRPGALASLRPRVRVPPAARGAFASMTPVNIAAWALGGFYFSLMPAVVRVATGATLPIVGGIVVAALTFTGGVVVVALRKLAPERMLRSGIVALTIGVAITLAGVQYQFVSIMLFGTVVSGLGFGSVFSGALRSVLPWAAPDDRAALLSAFYVEGYLAFSLPAVLAGFLAPVIGLTRTADFYGIAVIVLALVSLAATALGKKDRGRLERHPQRGSQ
jgi:MFS family permease